MKKLYWVDFQASIKVEAENEQEAEEIVNGILYELTSLEYTQIDNVEEAEEK